MPPGKSCWSRRRIQIRRNPQEHANNSSMALTHNEFLKSEGPEREISMAKRVAIDGAGPRHTCLELSTFVNFGAQLAHKPGVNPLVETN
jgi:hypothetical protein